MRKIIYFLLAQALAGCTLQPATPIVIHTATARPTPTPAIIVQTVMVTVMVTQVPAETSSANTTPMPSPTKGPPTKQAKTQTPTALVLSAPSKARDSNPVTLDQTLGSDFFSTITLTRKNLALRCEPASQITFQVTPSNSNIAKVDFYYRIEDRATNLIFDWQGPYRMNPDTNGNFALTFSGEDVNSSYRFPNSWLDFQFVGLNDSGGRVGNSEKIVQQVSYTFDCP